MSISKKAQQREARIHTAVTETILRKAVSTIIETSGAMTLQDKVISFVLHASDPATQRVKLPETRENSELSKAFDEIEILGMRSIDRTEEVTKVLNIVQEKLHAGMERCDVFNLDSDASISAVGSKLTQEEISIIGDGIAALRAHNGDAEIDMLLILDAAKPFITNDAMETQAYDFLQKISPVAAPKRQTTATKPSRARPHPQQN